MAKFLIPLGNGKWQGFWDDEDGAPPPPEAVAVSQDVIHALMADRKRLYVDGDVQEAPPVQITPEQQLAALSPVSHAQIIAALIGSDILTEAEGVAWITGTLPASVEAMLAALPAEQRTIARLRAIRPSSVVPTDPLVAALAAAEGKSVEDLIVIFTAAAAL